MSADKYHQQPTAAKVWHGMFCWWAFSVDNICTPDTPVDMTFERKKPQNMTIDDVSSVLTFVIHAPKLSADIVKITFDCADTVSRQGRVV